MADTHLTPPDRRMSLWQKWIRLSLANKTAILTSILALILTIVNIAFSVKYSKKQTNLDAAVATFQVQVQATADFQYNQQLAFQQSQLDMQSQMNTWARQQALPFVEVIVPPEHVFTVYEIKAERVNSQQVIIGTGTLDLLLANNGGGRAGLIGAQWVEDIEKITNLDMQVSELTDDTGDIPNTIEAQTPLKIELGLKAIVPYSGDPNGKSDYQLGEFWKKAIESNPNHLVVNFSNNDPIHVEISEILLTMPETSFISDPPSLFMITNKTPLVTTCFETGTDSVKIKFTYIEKNATITAVISDGTCKSFPQGNYQIIYQDPRRNNLIRENISLQSGNSSPVIINTNATINFNPWTGIAYLDITNSILWKILWTILLAIPTYFTGRLLSSLPLFERGTLQIFVKQTPDSIPKIVYSKPIQIYPWGRRIKLPYHLELSDIMIRKDMKNGYEMKIRRKNGQMPDSLFTLGKNDDYVEIGQSELGSLQISFERKDRALESAS